MNKKGSQLCGKSTDLPQMCTQLKQIFLSSQTLLRGSILLFISFYLSALWLSGSICINHPAAQGLNTMQNFFAFYLHS